MAAENENVSMVVDGEADEEDFADAAVEALDGAFDVGDFPTVAEMATLRATATPHTAHLWSSVRVAYALKYVTEICTNSLRV